MGSEMCIRDRIFSELKCKHSSAREKSRMQQKSFECDRKNDDDTVDRGDDCSFREVESFSQDSPN